MIRVICKARIKPEEQDDFEKAYLQVTANVTGTPGHLRDELLRSAEDGTTYILLAEWETEEQFRAWADDPRHIEESAPMFPFWVDTFERHIYRVRATLDRSTPAKANGAKATAAATKSAPKRARRT